MEREGKVHYEQPGFRRSIPFDSIQFRFAQKKNVNMYSRTDRLPLLQQGQSTRQDCGRLNTKDGNGKSEGARDERSIEAEPLRNEIETERNSAQLPRLRCTFVRVYSMHTPRIASLQHTAYLKQ